MVHYVYCKVMTILALSVSSVTVFSYIQDIGAKSGARSSMLILTYDSGCYRVQTARTRMHVLIRGFGC